MGFKFKRFTRSVGRSVKKFSPVFNPAVAISQKIAEETKDFGKKIGDTFKFGTEFGKSGGQNFLDPFQQMFDAQRRVMLGETLDVSKGSASDLERFLELNAAPKINKVRSVGELGAAIKLITKDIGEKANAMRLAKEAGALDIQDGKVKFLDEGASTFKDFMNKKSMRELEAKRALNKPEDIGNLINRVQEHGVQKSFAPKDSRFSQFLARVQDKVGSSTQSNNNNNNSNVQGNA